MTTNLPMGGCPAVDRKVGITISGLEQWKDGIVSGATVKVEIIQHGQVIHREVFSGKASAQFTRVVVIKAGYGELITIHDRPDLPGLKVSAEFASEQQPFVIYNGSVFIKDALIDGAATYQLKCGVEEKTPEEKLRDSVAALVTEQIKRMLQPGGMLHRR